MRGFSHSEPIATHMTTDAAIAAYLRHLSAERQLAPRTVAAYHGDLQRFAAALRESQRDDIAAVDAYTLKDYLAQLREERDCRPATLNRVISTLKGFFAWLRRTGEIGADPSAGLRRPRQPSKLPLHLTPGEARDLLLEGDPEDPNCLRDRTVLTLLAMTGIRLSELTGLDVADVDLERGCLRVLGKGRKERLVPLNPPARRAVEEWLRERPRPRPGCPALFLSRDGGRISHRTVQYLLRKAVKRLGLDPRISPHKLRHTFATLLYGEAVELRDIQELLGHASVATTAIYTHTNVDRMRAAVEKLKVAGKGSPRSSGEHS